MANTAGHTLRIPLWDEVETNATAAGITPSAWINAAIAEKLGAAPAASPEAAALDAIRVIIARVPDQERERPPRHVAV